MSLKFLDLKQDYRSESDNLITDFYLPCLERSITYDRAVGYFSSKSIVAVARGLTAFIAGLNQASEVAAPLVMDTPFGHLDDIRKKNIINYLSYPPSQVIVLATDEDLPEDTLHKLKPYIAQIQHIKRLDASEYASYVEVEA